MPTSVSVGVDAGHAYGMVRTSSSRSTETAVVLRICLQSRSRTVACVLVEKKPMWS